MVMTIDERLKQICADLNEKLITGTTSKIFSVSSNDGVLHVMIILNDDIVETTLRTVSKGLYHMLVNLCPKDDPFRDQIQYRIRHLFITGGISEFTKTGISGQPIGVDLMDSNSSPLELEQIVPIKTPSTLREMRAKLMNPEELLIGESTLERCKFFVSQLRSQKNAPHNMEVTFDMISEGNIKLDLGDKVYEGYYKFPENSSLWFMINQRQYNKIETHVDLHKQPITVETNITGDIDGPSFVFGHEVAADVILDIFTKHHINIGGGPVDFKTVHLGSGEPRPELTFDTNMVLPVKLLLKK